MDECFKTRIVFGTSSDDEETTGEGVEQVTFSTCGEATTNDSRVDGATSKASNVSGRGTSSNEGANVVDSYVTGADKECEVYLAKETSMGRN
mgnify:CR=1 FL=1